MVPPTLVVQVLVVMVPVLCLDVIHGRRYRRAEQLPDWVMLSGLTAETERGWRAVAEDRKWPNVVLVLVRAVPECRQDKRSSQRCRQ